MGSMALQDRVRFKTWQHRSIETFVLREHNGTAYVACHIQIGMGLQAALQAVHWHGLNNIQSSSSTYEEGSLGQGRKQS